MRTRRAARLLARRCRRRDVTAVSVHAVACIPSKVLQVDTRCHRSIRLQRVNVLPVVAHVPIMLARGLCVQTYAQNGTHHVRAGVIKDALN